jgi:hypothetical protein
MSHSALHRWIVAVARKRTLAPDCWSYVILVTGLRQFVEQRLRFFKIGSLWFLGHIRMMWDPVLTC